MCVLYLLSFLVIFTGYIQILVIIHFVCDKSNGFSDCSKIEAHVRRPTTKPFWRLRNRSAAEYIWATAANFLFAVGGVMLLFGHRAWPLAATGQQDTTPRPQARHRTLPRMNNLSDNGNQVTNFTNTFNGRA